MILARQQADLYEASIEPIGRLDALKKTWVDLQARSRCSFFQSWHWIGTWLSVLPQPVHPKLLLVRYSGQVVGAAILCDQRKYRHRILASNSIFLNEAGTEDHDCLTMEYNGFLADTRMECQVIRRSIGALLDAPFPWDELYLSGIEHRSYEAWGALYRDSDLHLRTIDKKPCYLTDLREIAGGVSGMLRHLSSNSRYQIRRSMRVYEREYGKTPRIDYAQNVHDASRYLQRLKNLHQPYWISRGRPGSFSYPFFEQFHTRLIQKEFSSRTIQLARIMAGHYEIGYLYNFCWQNRIYSYQSGFSYDDNPKKKPGMVSHSLAIADAAEKGLVTYDFLAGEARHKKTLASARTDMYWLSLQKNRIKLRAERNVRWLKHRIENKVRQKYDHVRPR